MGQFASLEDAQRFFAGDRFATCSGMTLDELDAEHAVCRVTLDARHRNALGGVMGGAIFTLGDFAFAALTNDAQHATVAQQVSINYLAAPKGDRLTARATYLKDGRTSCVVNVDISDDTGRAVAQFTGLGFKLR